MAEERGIDDRGDGAPPSCFVHDRDESGPAVSRALSFGGPLRVRSVRRPTEDGLATLARQVYAFRRRRDRVFQTPGLFGEPAWDMMLDIFVHQSRGERLGVFSLCQASGVAQSTALRWVGSLERQGLIIRENDPNDARRSFVKLTPSAFERVRLCLSED